MRWLVYINFRMEFVIKRDLLKQWVKLLTDLTFIISRKNKDVRKQIFKWARAEN